MFQLCANHDHPNAQIARDSNQKTGENLSKGGFFNNSKTIIAVIEIIMAKPQDFVESVYSFHMGLFHILIGKHNNRKEGHDQEEA